MSSTASHRHSRRRGIGGLSLALGLRSAELKPTCTSRRAELAEIGAAVALSANSTTRELRASVVLDALDRRFRPNPLS